MKKNIVTTIVIATFVALVSVMAVSAQVSSRLKVNVPFDFYANGKLFAAGSYTLESISPRSSTATLKLSGQKNTDVAILMLQREADTTVFGQAVVSFDRYGDTYYLAGVSNPNERFAAHAIQSRSEKNLARAALAPKATVAVKIESK
ncbi:MAG: hypothetical protein JO053_07080 [Acidobacteria bacterium]|nr:hypothetical protein [Acidobacteriota bacterium]